MVLDANSFEVDSDSQSYTNTTTEETPVEEQSTFNAVDYLIGSLNNSLDSVQLDRSLMMQSQVSGTINNTMQDLLRTMDEVSEKLENHIKRYEQLKTQIIPELNANLDKNTKLCNKLTKKIKETYPVEYSKSRDKVLNRVTEEDEDLYI
ncbi:hypothetical protein KL905_003603 [Ogataea polymorpha]|uniref:Biogenesis of lysosome-related organelles complex 1 subunit KXD1 n=1 Tax=Ogataea polymorpha TaxID=460523 RepID=A0A1B7SAR1_9ASCO|nr:uncharacterized protein OGAPODRAFT_95735 [Ogataea polymorpha]KAG7879002.1 hypothetical protein KL937_003415 [Ogataea polymorpha]KAG7887867.1 hypothetical protein KL936_003885 [Ogataea polymorpha]KAG7892064.1 hypothetical protein KL908_003669 [Ogataea polymorpha]KAG7899321.1 hypothetical protein KL935_003631 [Ogataea polymorpha]KAG7904537.1 hypothetical protein KL907_003413 [Ogataea polymorpha]